MRKPHQEGQNCRVMSTRGFLLQLFRAGVKLWKGTCNNIEQPCFGLMCSAGLAWPVIRVKSGQTRTYIHTPIHTPKTIQKTHTKKRVEEERRKERKSLVQCVCSMSAPQRGSSAGPNWKRACATGSFPYPLFCQSQTVTLACVTALASRASCRR